MRIITIKLLNNSGGTSENAPAKLIQRFILLAVNDHGNSRVTSGYAGMMAQGKFKRDGFRL